MDWPNMSWFWNAKINDDLFQQYSQLVITTLVSFPDPSRVGSGNETIQPRCMQASASPAYSKRVGGADTMHGAGDVVM